MAEAVTVGRDRGRGRDRWPGPWPLAGAVCRVDRAYHEGFVLFFSMTKHGFKYKMVHFSLDIDARIYLNTTNLYPKKYRLLTISNNLGLDDQRRTIV